ncbi:MAG: hypothetical protein GVY13_08925 [Alphaproteobacteria bacterium]|jgi:predicted transcriptional regulator|nr:hypothetical protein [Alphaproteobacteria bacterium]
MITRLEKALEAVGMLPEKRQEELAEVLETAVESPLYALAPDELRELEEGIADANAGRFATDEEVDEVFGRFGRV